MNPQTIAQFKIIDVIGRGSVGIVYRARDTETNHYVAVKLLTADVFSDPDIERRFVREVAILQRLKHDNIVGHIDCGLHDERIYLAMEFVQGGTLRDMVRDSGCLNWRDAVKYAIGVCGGLEYAHRYDVIHRDLKPANVLLSARGTVKLCDFGIARDKQRARLTEEGSTVGTVRYMAPEQIRADDELTGRCDLYSLGCVMFEMLTGEPPFDGDSVAEVLHKHLHTDPPSIVDEVSSCPRDLSQVTSWLLAKKPARRPRSAQQVGELLRDVLAEKPISLSAD